MGKTNFPVQNTSVVHAYSCLHKYFLECIRINQEALKSVIETGERVDGCLLPLATSEELMREQQIFPALYHYG